MATISQRISIEGADDIRKQFDELAKAGAAAFQQIQDAAEKTKVDPAAQQSFEDLVAAGSKLAGQFDELAKAASQSAPEIEQVGKAAAATGESLVAFADAGDKAAQAITAVADTGKQATTEVAKSGDAAEKSSVSYADLTLAGDKAAQAITAVADTSKQATTEVAKSGDAAEKSSVSYANLALNVVRTGASVVQAGVGIASAGTAAATLGVQAIGAAAAVGTFALTLGSTVVAAIGAAITGLGILTSALERTAFDVARLSDTLDHLATNASGLGQSFTSLQVGQQAFAQIGISGEKFRSVIASLAKDLESLKPGDAIEASTKKITDATNQLLAAEKALLEVQIKREAEDISAPRAPFDAQQRILAITEELNNSTQKQVDAEKDLKTAREESAKAAANNLTNILELMQQVELKTKASDTFIGPVRPTFDALTTIETKINAVKIRLQDVVKAGGDVSKSLLNIIANLPKEDAFKVGAAFGLSETDVDRIRRYGTEVTKIDNLFAKIRGAGVLISPSDATTFEQMNESSQRLASAWERLKQAWASTIFSGLAASGATVFNNLTALAVEFAALVVETFNTLIGQLFTTLGQIASGWGTIFSMIGQGWVAIGQLIARVVTTTAGAVESVQSASDQATALIGTWITTPVGNAWQWIKDTWDGIVAWISAKIDQATALITAWVTTPVGNAWQWIKDKWNAMLKGLGFGGAAPPVGDKTPPVGAAPPAGDSSGLVQLIASRRKSGSVPLPQPIPREAFSDAEDLFEEKFNKIAELVNKAATALEDFREIPIDQNAEKLKDAVLAIAQQLPEVEGIAAGLTKIPQVADAMDGLKAGIVETVKGATKALKDFNADAVFEPIVASASNAADQVKEDFKATQDPNAWQWIVDTFNSVVGSLGSAIGEATALITSWVTTPISNAWQWIVDTFNSVVSSLRSAIDQATALITTWVTTPISNAWQWIVDAWNAMLQKLGFGGGGSSPAPAGAGGMASGGVVRGRPGTDTNLAWLTAGEFVIRREAVQAYGLGFLHAINAMRAPHFAGGGLVGIPAYASGGEVMSGILSAKEVDQVLTRVRVMIDNIALAIAQTNDAIIDSMRRVMRDIDRAMTQFSQSIQSLLESTKTASDTLWDFQQSHASGGLLGGRGTGTSDSNLAWVSRGEYITPARAVAQPGVLDFLEVLRRSGGNLRDVLYGMTHFAMGGLVHAPIGIPAFAGGGMNHVTIQFPGLPAITGLRASSDVVEELRRSAALAQVRSGGRKPSRYS